MVLNLIVIAISIFFGWHFHNLYGIEKNNASVRKKYIAIVSFFLILQSGLRNVAVGDDTFSYQDGYQDVKFTSWSVIKQSVLEYYSYKIGKDPGFLVLQKLEQMITYNFQFFLILLAIAFFSSLGFFLYKNTTRLVDLVFAYLIYSTMFYSFYSITGLRQTTATIFILFSFHYVKKRKFLPFLILVLLASTMHKSSLIFLVYYFVSRVKNTKYFYNAMLFLFPVFFLFKEKMGAYLRVMSGYEDYGQTENAGTLNFTILFLLISLVSLLRRKVILKNNPDAIYYYNAFSIALIFLPLSWINPNAIRIIMYFSIFMVLFIPEIIFSFKRVSQKMYIDLLLLSMMFLTVLHIKFGIAEDKRMPYGFFWEDMKLTKQYYERD